MPRKQRHPKARTADHLTLADAVSAFRWSMGGAGIDTFLSLPGFRSHAEAAQAWEVCRRLVWAQTERFRVPPSATCFDGLTTEALEHLHAHWNQGERRERYPLADTLDALARDRAALEAFLATRAARDIADYLTMFAEDLDTLERVARHLGTFPAEELWRPYPVEVRTAATYGGPAARIVPLSTATADDDDP